MFAFDSFDGLPEFTEDDAMANYGIFKTGEYACTKDRFLKYLKARDVPLDLVETIEGFFDDTLKPELIETMSISPAVVIHIDCDLYSSALPVLEFIVPLLQDGTVLLFDDYYCYRANPQYGVQRAFKEWVDRHGISYTHYANYEWCGCALIVHPASDPNPKS